MNLEKKLWDIFAKISKKETDLFSASSLYREAKKGFFSAEEKEKTEKVDELAAKIFFFLL
jgi:hypothetical protein